MKPWYKRAWLWLGEIGQRHTVGEDFGGDLVVQTQRGPVFIPYDFEYDRFTLAYDTEYPDLWSAAALHDYGYSREFIYGGNFRCREHWDSAFYDEMVRGASRIRARLCHDGLCAEGKAEYDRLMKRARVYYYAVRALGGAVHWLSNRG